MPAVEEQKTEKQVPSQSMKRNDSASRIEAEIAAIRKRCEIKCVIDVGDVRVKGHKRKMDEFDDGADENQLTRHFGVDSDDEEKTKHIFVS